ncbi:MAG: DUF3196 family protein [Erysipelotrichaceae bacterium]|nr:DUF3196 family protein [Erysipelotrichaceae bacterium]
MNYYEETLSKIDALITDGKKEEALRLIANELNMPYLPKDFEEELRKLLQELKRPDDVQRSFSEEEILSFLDQDEKYQLLAVSHMDKMNLRNHTEAIGRFLADEERSVNAKALLIDSLIFQQIDHVFLYKTKDRKARFNPKDLKRADEGNCFLKAKKILEETYMKEPSKLKLAMQLLYKETMLFLPLEIEEKDSRRLAEKIIAYIDAAFER